MRLTHGKGVRMLIKHNTREGDRTPGHFAHDTTRKDVSGTNVNGRTDKFYTSRKTPCPQCGGWRELVEIDKLARSTHPIGSTVGTYNLLKDYSSYVPGPLAGTWEGGEGIDEEPEVVGAWTTSTGEPIPSSGEIDSVETIARYESPERVVDVDKAKAANALGDLLSAFMPDSNKIQQDIATAVESVKVDMRQETQTTVSAALAILDEKFKDTVATIVAPKVYVIKQTEQSEPIKVVGVHSAFEDVLFWLTARDHEGLPGNVFLTGPAGSGKTTLARHISEALGLEFYATGQVLSEHQVTGFVDAGGSYHPTPFQDAFVNGGVWLGDEFDAWSPEAALAMNGGLANGHATFPNDTKPVKRHEDSYFIVAGNTWGTGQDREYVGRNQMDAASLSRFVTINVDYDRGLEQQLANGYNEWLHMVWTARDKARELKIRMTFGTRELVHGVRAINAGKSVKDCAEVILKRNMADDVWRKLGVTA